MYILKIIAFIFEKIYEAKNLKYIRSGTELKFVYFKKTSSALRSRDNMNDFHFFKVSYARIQNKMALKYFFLVIYSIRFKFVYFGSQAHSIQEIVKFGKGQVHFFTYLRWP